MRAKEFINEKSYPHGVLKYIRRAKKHQSQEKIDELTFKGSQCTKDCSGHRAGYEWYRRKQRTPNSWSQSFNNGAAIAAAGK